MYTKYNKLRKTNTIKKNEVKYDAIKWKAVSNKLFSCVEDRVDIAAATDGNATPYPFLRSLLLGYPSISMCEHR